MIALFLLFVSNALAVDVVCTLPWLSDITARIAPDAQVTTLARGVDDPHTLSPTPALIARVAAADLYVVNGMQLELWSEKLLDSAGNPRIRPGQPGYVVATENIPRLEVPTDLSRARGDLHPDGNPHVWLDPLNAPIAADNIAAGLSRIDPANAATYAANAKAFRVRIHEAMFGADLVAFMGGDLLARLSQGGKLDAFLASKGLSGRMGGWAAKAAPLRGSPVIFYHNSWPYFAARFGVETVGFVEDRPGVPPTAAHRDELLGAIGSRGVKVIAVGSYYDDRIPNQLAAASGARVARVPGDVGATAEATDYFALIDALIAAVTP